MLLVMLVMIRNAYGVLTVFLTGGTFLLVSWLAGPQVQAAFAYAVVWFLLVGGVRPAFELQAKRSRGGAGDSDADQLSGSPTSRRGCGSSSSTWCRCAR